MNRWAYRYALSVQYKIHVLIMKSQITVMAQTNLLSLHGLCTFQYSLGWLRLALTFKSIVPL